MENNLDKRQFRRIRSSSFRIKFPSRRPDERGLFSSEWEEVIPHNFSAGGALFEYNMPINLGAFLSLILHFPESQIPINCVGHVVRIEDENASPDGFRRRIAVNFIGLDEEIKKLADETVAELSDDAERGTRTSG